LTARDRAERVVDAAIDRTRRMAISSAEAESTKALGAETRRQEIGIMDEPPKLSPQELARRQAIIDAQWEGKLIEQQHRREQAERRSTLHKGPGDADFNL
jgi:hypothetical protein